MTTRESVETVIAEELSVLMPRESSVARQRFKAERIAARLAAANLLAGEVDEEAVQRLDRLIEKRFNASLFCCSGYERPSEGHDHNPPCDTVINRKALREEIMREFPALAARVAPSATHIPYPGEPFDPNHAHDWADNACQSQDCMARPDGTTQPVVCVAPSREAPQPGKRLDPEFRADLVHFAKASIEDVWKDVPGGVDAETLAQNIVGAQEFMWISRGFPVSASRARPAESEKRA